MERTSTSLKKTVYDGILSMITDGELVAGSIISEKAIIEKFNCSKSPVREAMIELCKDDVLTSIPRCGYQIKQVSAKTLSEIVELRLMLELSNFRNIAPKISIEQINIIFNPLEEKRTKVGKSILEAQTNNLEFHIALAKLSGNTLLVDYIQNLMNLYSRAYAQMCIVKPGIISPSENHNHALLLTAWKDSDFEKAECYLRKDILSTLEQFNYNI